MSNEISIWDVDGIKFDLKDRYAREAILKMQSIYNDTLTALNGENVSTITNAEMAALRTAHFTDNGSAVNKPTVQERLEWDFDQSVVEVRNDILTYDCLFKGDGDNLIKYIEEEEEETNE